MIDLMGFFKKRKEENSKKRKRNEAVRLAFTQRYLNFKSCSAPTTRSWKSVNELEQALQGAPRIRHVLCPGQLHRPFGKPL